MRDKEINQTECQLFSWAAAETVDLSFSYWRSVYKIKLDQQILKLEIILNWEIIQNTHNLKYQNTSHTHLMQPWIAGEILINRTPSTIAIETVARETADNTKYLENHQ